MDFGLKLLLLVREQEEFNVGVGAASHVHGRELVGLQNTYNQLGRAEQGKGIRKERGRKSQMSDSLKWSQWTAAK